MPTPEQQSPLRYWTRCAARLIAAGAEIHPPPAHDGAWSFVNTFVSRLEIARKEGAKMELAEAESAAYRGFQAWYQRVARELWDVAETLGELRRLGGAPMELQADLLDVAHQLHDGYRDHHEAGTIQWLPEQFEWKLPDGSRDRVTILEMLKRSIGDAEGYGRPRLKGAA